MFMVDRHHLDGGVLVSDYHSSKAQKRDYRGIIAIHRARDISLKRGQIKLLGQHAIERLLSSPRNNSQEEELRLGANIAKSLQPLTELLFNETPYSHPKAGREDSMPFEIFRSRNCLKRSSQI